jgi:hypothetical protein
LYWGLRRFGTRKLNDNRTFRGGTFEVFMLAVKRKDPEFMPGERSWLSFD